MGKIKMVICIGSSCFARGNAENVKITEDFLAKRRRISINVYILLFFCAVNLQIAVIRVHAAHKFSVNISHILRVPIAIVLGC